MPAASSRRGIWKDGNAIYYEGARFYLQPTRLVGRFQEEIKPVFAEESLLLDPRIRLEFSQLFVS
jgi:hypothetical protein